ncbi:hypothetical protein JMJ77_0007987 [Colletotrichum scovillei]|uniref:Uncharacterized protein n=1 Tax=Colletotrichum scovillei TaxID=1209932 RepID=A0A9P7RDA7_9PEZI|nr:hypothetical protein JMJ77_0007987 [Colletotrichum scovillei]KAG7074965.1 hypothetical protein JMJ76_0011430 [Colletotrichum scovillei]KAG7082031.1 hypothetical protein JMJ78_0004138 [Colletotrichum scovillei]
MEENERALADRQEPMNHGRRTRDLFLLPWAAMAGAVQQTVCARPHRTAGNCRLHDAAALTPRHPRKMAAEDNNEEMNQRPVGVGFGSWGDGEPGTGKTRTGTGTRRRNRIGKLQGSIWQSAVLQCCRPAKLSKETKTNNIIHGLCLWTIPTPGRQGRRSHRA